MSRYILDIEDDSIGHGQILEALYKGGIESTKDIIGVKENWETADGTARMTTQQRDKLWALCGSYNVPFREDDYFASQFSPNSPIMYEGWVGGNEYSHLLDPRPEKTTIWVGVEPNGRSHS